MVDPWVSMVPSECRYGASVVFPCLRRGDYVNSHGASMVLSWIPMVLP